MHVRIFVALLFVTAVGVPMAGAQDVTATEQVTFIVSWDAPQITPLTADHIAIVTGRPLGLIDTAGSCNSGTGFPLHNVVVVDRWRGAVTATVIMIRFDPVPAGTRLENLQDLGSCNGPDGSPYEKYRADVQHKAQ